MDRHIEVRFAIGSFASVDAAHALGIEPPPTASSDTAGAVHSVVDLGNEAWLTTSDSAVRDLAVARLADRCTVIRIDCWSSVAENATVARFRIEERRGAQSEVRHEDRRHPHLARAGVLSAVAADWLVAKVKSVSRAKSPPRPSKREADRRARATQLVEHLVASGAIALKPGSAVDDLVERTARILFVIAKTRTQAIPALMRMIGDTRHVEREPGDVAPQERGIVRDAVRSALDSIRYRK